MEQFPLYQKTRLMLSFNVLFTHKITYLQLSICRRENEWGSAPFILLYLSLTIWIANRTIYHGVVIYFMLAAQVSLPLIYGNTLYIMKFNKSFGVNMGKPSCRTSKTLATLFFPEGKDSDIKALVDEIQLFDLRVL